MEELSADDDDDRGLDIGAQTSAGLEAALFETDSAGEETSPDLSFDDLAATQESPTIETRAQASADDDDWGGITMESPTIEQAGPEAATVETPSFDDDSELPTMESPTIETANPATAATVQQAGPTSADLTAELELDDLGLDVADLDELPGDLGDLPAAEASTSDTREQPAIDADDDLLSATGVTQVLQGGDDDDDSEYTSTAIISDDEATMMAPVFGFDDEDDSDATGIHTEVLEQHGSSIPGGEHSLAEAEDDLDLNLDDLTQALEGADTVEQPRASSFGTGMFDSTGTGTPVDLDIGADIVGDDDPTGTEEVGPLDPQTMTEVGTKLDLARAYIDMGDPEGAKSILEEVLSEGDSSQRREAQSLIDALPA
jgi:pilus assembly protein FimV